MKKVVEENKLPYLKRKIDKYGYNSLEIEETLSLIIGLSSNDINSNITAKVILKKFGTLAKIFNAPIDELLKIENLTEETALMLKSIPHFSEKYFESLKSRSKRVHNIEEAYERFKYKLLGKQKECVAIIVLSSNGTIMYEDIIWEGTFSKVPIYVRDLVSICLKYNADSIIVAHNHPSGSLLPSKGDIGATREIQLALDSVYVYLQDHLILTDENYISLRNSGWMNDLNSKINNFRQNMIMDANLIEEQYGFTEK